MPGPSVCPSPGPGQSFVIDCHAHLLHALLPALSKHLRTRPGCIYTHHPAARTHTARSRHCPCSCSQRPSEPSHAFRLTSGSSQQAWLNLRMNATQPSLTSGKNTLKGNNFKVISFRCLHFIKTTKNINTGAISSLIFQ